MIVIEQTARELCGLHPLERIELAGRTCYKSLGNMKEGSALKFVQTLVNRRHFTPTEQVAVKIPVPLLESKMYLINAKIQANKDYPRTQLAYGEPIVYNNVFIQSITGPARAFFEVGVSPDLLQDPNIVVDDDYITIEFVTDRGVANEFIRHRALAYGDDGYPTALSDYQHEDSADEQGLVQESTRYVNYSNKDFYVVRPVPCFWAYDESSEMFNMWKESCEASYNVYKKLCGLGSAPQISRNVLPLSTATTVVMSGYKHQWIDLIFLRMAPDAQPQARYLGAQILDIIKPKLDTSDIGYNRLKDLKGYYEDIMEMVSNCKGDLKNE